MKRTIYTLLAAIMISSCQKQDSITTQPATADVSLDGDFYSSKATIAADNKKAADDGLYIDYDLVIKQVSANTYKLKGKLVGGIVGKGKGLAGSKKIEDAIYAMTITIKGPKTDAAEPLLITLKSTGKEGNTFEFPEFEYKGDLSYELLETSSSFLIKGGDLTINNTSSFTVGGTTINVNDGNFKPGNDFIIKEGTMVVVEQQKLETGFAILFSAKDDECRLVDNSSFFLLPKGKTVEQDPKAVKVTFPKVGDGSRVMRITVAGDPAQKVTGVFYTPLPIPDPNNPGSTIQFEAIEFDKSLSDKKIGICCYDRCIGKDTGVITICGTTHHFKPADFNSFGEGWARISMISAL